MSDSDYYGVKVLCTNCGYSGSVKLRKGSEVYKNTCPDCGCKRLIQDTWKGK
jgi:predicted  nucleic acid-binding Zn-ribbon protein